MLVIQNFIRNVRHFLADLSALFLADSLLTFLYFQSSNLPIPKLSLIPLVPQSLRLSIFPIFLSFCFMVHQSFQPHPYRFQWFSQCFTLIYTYNSQIPLAFSYKISAGFILIFPYNLSNPDIL